MHGRHVCRTRFSRLLLLLPLRLSRSFPPVLLATTTHALLLLVVAIVALVVVVGGDDDDAVNDGLCLG